MDGYGVVGATMVVSPSGPRRRLFPTKAFAKRVGLLWGEGKSTGGLPWNFEAKHLKRK
jgi:hypothetical protein